MTINKPRIAITLNGYLRTWNLCKDMILNTFVDIFRTTDIDWYVALWESSTATPEEVKQFFIDHNQNLVDFQWVNTKDNLLMEYLSREPAGGKFRYPITSVYGPYYLRSLSLAAKRRYEFLKGITYDIVVVTRPDVVYFVNKMTKEKIPNPKRTWNWKDFDFHTIFHDPHVVEYSGASAHDTFFISGSIASDLIGHMYLDLNTDLNKIKQLPIRREDTHTVASQYFRRHNINSFYETAYICPCIVRPNVDLSVLQETKNKLNALDGPVPLNHPYFDTDTMWATELKHTPENTKLRIDSCNRLGIDLVDYDGLLRYKQT